MLQRIILAALVLFWGTMIWLLWRAEYGSRGSAGSPVPAVNVWHRVLTAPDDSSLEIRQRGKKIGTCRWSANVGETVATGRAPTLEDLQPEGRILSISDYTLDLDGQVTLANNGPPYKFRLHADVGTNHAWRSFLVTVTQRPQSWQVEASATEQTVGVSMREGESEWRQSFTFDELKQPDRLLAQFGVPWGAGLLAGFTGGARPDVQNLAASLRWEARQDWFHLGRTPVRAYRLSARLFDKFEIVIILSRVGEILRVELPGEIVAINDAFLQY